MICVRSIERGRGGTTLPPLLMSPPLFTTAIKNRASSFIIYLPLAPAFLTPLQIYARSDPGDPSPSYCTVFHHMVKSAGSTIKRSMTVASAADGGSAPGGPAIHTPCMMLLQRNVLTSRASHVVPNPSTLRFIVTRSPPSFSRTP